MWYGGIGSSRAQLSSMMPASSSEMSRHQRSFQRSSNQACELVAGVVVEDVDVQLALALESPARVRLLLPRKPIVGLIGSVRWRR